MRTKFLILLASAGVLAAIAFPAGWDPGSTAPAAPEAAPVPLALGVSEAGETRLWVESGPQTVVDRGTVTELTGGQELHGSFRYWEEPAGRALYVWDKTQTLVARVLNPTAVTLVTP